MALVAAVVDAVLTPFINAIPSSPTSDTPLLWGLLAWVRRNVFNQSPVVHYDPSQNTVSTSGVTTGNLGATDPEGDQLTYTVTGNPKYGTVTIDQSTGTFTYTPDETDPDYPDLGGIDSFQVLVSDNKLNLLSLFNPHGGDPMQLVGAPVPGKSLAELMRENAGRYFGSAINIDGLTTDPQYKDLAAFLFDAVTAEREMKWDVTEPARGVFDFSAGDAIAAFAEQNGMLIRGHNIIWSGSTPAWVTDGNFTADELRAVLKEHIDAVVGHYKGQVYAWDVVNEPLTSPYPVGPVTPGMKNDVFYQTLGEDYIADAFRYARAADPNAKLYLNEILAEGSGPRADALYDLVKRLKDQGVPIDGIGFESHFVTYPGGDVPADMAATMQRFADLGLDVSITELDVSVPADPQGHVDPDSLGLQATSYQSAVRSCLTVSRCVGVTTWGFTDLHSWLTSPDGSPAPGGIPGFAAGDLYDQNYQPKSAYYAVRDLLIQSRSQQSALSAT